MNWTIIRHADTLGRMLAVLQSHGYPSVEAQPPISNRSSERPVDALAEAYARKRLSFRLRGTPALFEIYVDGAWGESWLDEVNRSWLSITTYYTGFFTHDEGDSKHYSGLLLDLAMKLYEVLLPSFGWIDISDPAGHTSFEDVEQLALPRPYWATFLGPAYVTKYGEMALDATFGGTKRLLPDGGLLYVLSESLALR